MGLWVCVCAIQNEMPLRQHLRIAVTSEPNDFVHSSTHEMMIYLDLISFAFVLYKIRRTFRTRNMNIIIGVQVDWINEKVKLGTSLSHVPIAGPRDFFLTMTANGRV